MLTQTNDYLHHRELNNWKFYAAVAYELFYFGMICNKHRHFGWCKLNFKYMCHLGLIVR